MAMSHSTCQCSTKEKMPTLCMWEGLYSLCQVRENPDFRAM